MQNYKLIETIYNGLFAHRIQELHVHNYQIIMKQYILNYLFLIIYNYYHKLLEEEYADTNNLCIFIFWCLANGNNHTLKNKSPQDSDI